MNWARSTALALSGADAGPAASLGQHLAAFGEEGAVVARLLPRSPACAASITRCRVRATSLKPRHDDVVGAGFVKSLHFRKQLRRRHDLRRAVDARIWRTSFSLVAPFSSASGMLSTISSALLTPAWTSVIEVADVAVGHLYT